MGIFGSRRPVTVLDEGCDRCGDAARVRVGRDCVIELKEFEGAPHGVEVKHLDLVFCGTDYITFAPMLHRQGWRVLDDRR